MDDIEFRGWLKHHSGAYPGLSGWLKSNPDQLKHWQRLLCDYGMTEAIAATNRMLELEDQPRGYHNHPRLIRNLIHSSRGSHYSPVGPEGPKLVGGDGGKLVANCYRCMDYGIVEVIAPRTLREIQQGKLTYLRTCVVACNCKLGERARKHQRLPCWNDQAMLIRFYDVLTRWVETKFRSMEEIAEEMLSERLGYEAPQPQSLEDWGHAESREQESATGAVCQGGQEATRNHEQDRGPIPRGIPAAND